MKNLFQVIQEAAEKREPTEAEIEEYYNRVWQLKKTGMPKSFSAIKSHLWNQSEYELYEFLDNAEYFEVGNKDAPHWYRTAAVSVRNNRIQFYYDKDFVDRLAKKPGELIFLIAHEASHIFRHHLDRAASQGHDGERSNIAADMIINDDIMITPKIAGWDPKLATNATFWGEEEAKKMGAKPDETFVAQIPKKFREDYESAGRDAYYYENMYKWLEANEEAEQKKQQKEGIDYFKEGSIVKVDKTGEYKRITKVNKDNTYETEAVDIEAEIKKVRG